MKTLEAFGLKQEPIKTEGGQRLARDILGRCLMNYLNGKGGE